MRRAVAPNHALNPYPKRVGDSLQKPSAVYPLPSYPLTLTQPPKGKTLTQTTMQPTVYTPPKLRDRYNPRWRNVKNLGWLLRHASQVKTLMVTPYPECGAVLYAELIDGRIYTCPFADMSICRRWIKRPCLSHITPYFPHD